MTRMQLDAQRFAEDARHNRETERISNYDATMRAWNERDKIDETKRSNRANEGLKGREVSTKEMLVPTQKFSNVAGGIGSMARGMGSLVGSLSSN